MYGWLPRVIQQVKPWMSEEDIEKGTRWLPELSKELDAHSVGIVCVTRSNLTSAWMNFEIGALAKAFDKSRVCPLLIDLRPSDITGPITQLQATLFDNREDVQRLVRTINRGFENPLTDVVLDDAFETQWPRLETAVKTHVATSKSGHPAPPRSDREILNEILELARATHREVKDARLATTGGLVDEEYRKALNQRFANQMANQMKRAREESLGQRQTRVAGELNPYAAEESS